MAKIHMHQTAAGPNGPYEAGKTYDVSGEIGSQYVSAGAAEWVEKPVERVVREPTETREEGAEEDLSSLNKPELVRMAEDRGVEVERADGGDGPPLKSDYVRVLSD